MICLVFVVVDSPGNISESQEILPPSLYSYCTDGHHRLVRWRLITHGGVNGYSSLIVYLHCSSDNKASTVYKSFLSAVEENELPSSVCTDYVPTADK